MNKAEIVNVSDEPYVDPNDKIENDEEDHPIDPIKPHDHEPQSDEPKQQLPYKSSNTVVYMEEKEEEHGFVQICAGSVGFDDKPQQTHSEEEKSAKNEKENEIQKSACCLLC